ncbi:MAG: hypothetical protein JWN45_1215 [Acidobacteriaceae bacterium]|nr:hypothetical protein [Acidobacteriaceae bacterium]
MLFHSLASRVLRAYKRFVSPLLLSSCRFTPTCSEYAVEAVERHGIFFGGLLSTWRILRCNPFSRGGLDTVPISLNGRVAQPPSAVFPEGQHMHIHFFDQARKR